MFSNDSVISSNIANLYRSPSSDSEQVSQAIYGTRTLVIEQSDDFTYVHTQDKYAGWVRAHHLTPSISTSAPTHRVVSSIALVKAQPNPNSAILAQLPMSAGLEALEDQSNNLKEWLCFDLAQYGPAFIKRTDIMDIKSLKLHSIKPTTRARALIGVPYLWGGTTPFGIDCSGLVQLCYGMVGMELLRDAEMQRRDRRTTTVPTEGSFKDTEFEDGDLVFFGKEGNAPATHIGIALGDGHFIHARGGYGVRIDSCSLERYNEMFIEARRFLPNSDHSIDSA